MIAHQLLLHYFFFYYQLQNILKWCHYFTESRFDLHALRQSNPALVKFNKTIKVRSINNVTVSVSGFFHNGCSENKLGGEKTLCTLHRLLRHDCQVKVKVSKIKYGLPRSFSLLLSPLVKKKKKKSCYLRPKFGSLVLALQLRFNNG